MKTNMKFLKKHSAKILFLATMGSLGFGFLGSVLNSHLLGAESFGDWKYLQSFVTMASYLVNFGLYSSGGRLIAATDNPTRIRTYKGYLLYFALFGFSVIVLSLIVTGLFIPKALNSGLFHLVLTMFPLFIVLPLGFYFESVYTGEKKILSLALYRFVPPFVYVLSLFILQSLGKGGSIDYNAFFYYGSFFVICIALILSDKPIFKRGTTEWSDLRAQHKSFGIQIYWGGLWGVGVIYLLPVLVGFFNIDNKDVGHYSLALSFIMPLSILPGIVGTSNFKNYMTLQTIPAKNFKVVLVSSALTLIALLLSIDFIVARFLKPEYKEVAMLIKLGSFGAILHGFGDFVNKFLMAKGESKYMKKVSIVSGVIQLMSSLVLIKLFSSTGGILAKSIGSLIFFTMLYLYYYRKYVVQKSEGMKVIINETEGTDIPENIKAE